MKWEHKSKIYLVLSIIGFIAGAVCLIIAAVNWNTLNLYQAAIAFLIGGYNRELHRLYEEYLIDLDDEDS